MSAIASQRRSRILKPKGIASLQLATANGESWATFIQHIDPSGIMELNETLLQLARNQIIQGLAFSDNSCVRAFDEDFGGKGA